MRRFFIDEIENMRDIGGYAIGNDKIVKEGKLIRTNMIEKLERKNLEKIKEMGFSTVIDLRSNGEIERTKGIFFGNTEFSYHHIAIKGEGRLPEKEDEIINTYIEMLDGKEQIKEIFEILSENEEGVIYYCNAGKDRTGVITALILKLLGVNEQDIEVDYVASGIYLEKKLKEYAERMHDEKILKIITPKDETISHLLEYIQEKYYSIEQYLESCGITGKQIKKIKEKYTQKI